MKEPYLLKVYDYGCGHIRSIKYSPDQTDMLKEKLYIIMVAYCLNNMLNLSLNVRNSNEILYMFHKTVQDA